MGPRVAARARNSQENTARKNQVARSHALPAKDASRVHPPDGALRTNIFKSRCLTGAAAATAKRQDDGRAARGGWRRPRGGAMSRLLPSDAKAKLNSALNSTWAAQKNLRGARARAH